MNKLEKIFLQKTGYLETRKIVLFEVRLTDTIQMVMKNVPLMERKDV